MLIGEDKSKVSNIVRDNIEHFQVLYNNILQECPQAVYKPQQGRLEVRSDGVRFRFLHYNNCPPDGNSNQIIENGLKTVEPVCTR